MGNCRRHGRRDSAAGRACRHTVISPSIHTRYRGAAAPPSRFPFPQLPRVRKGGLQIPFRIFVVWIDFQCSRKGVPSFDQALERAERPR
jgi:hypothetical protein